MRLPAKLALVVAAAAAVAVFAANRFLNTEPRLTINLHGARFSEVIVRPSVGSEQRPALTNGIATLPLTYGPTYLEFRSDDGSALWLYYFHADVGVRRLVKIQIDSGNPATGVVQLHFNGFKNHEVTFRFEDHQTMEQSLAIGR